MHAGDVIETVPTARPDEDLLSAVRMVSQHRLAGLVVADDQGGVVGCMSSIDLLRLALPRYLQEEPNLARVFDEEHADRIAARLVGTRVGDVLGETASRIPVAKPAATIVEVAELMVQWHCPLVLVTQGHGRMLGVVTANRLLELLVAAAEGGSG